MPDRLHIFPSSCLPKPRILLSLESLPDEELFTPSVLSTAAQAPLDTLLSPQDLALCST